MNLEALLSILPFYSVKQSIKNIKINKLENDHRLITKNDVFICVKGFTVDGHDFAQAAIDNGAKVIIAERDVVINKGIKVIVSNTKRALAFLSAKYYAYPSNDFPVIGITGTNGKTTISYILKEIFKEHRYQVGLIGTIQTEIAERNILMNNTTPDALKLQGIFKAMSEQGIDVCVMEVSSHALDLGRIYGTDFNIGVFTNLTQDHLDYHGNMDDYFRVKTLLFSYLGNTYHDNKKFTILNMDDKYSREITKSTAQHIVTYGINNKSDVMAKDISITASRTSFTIESPRGNIKVESLLIGKFNVYNMLAATTVALCMNIPLKTIKNALLSFKSVSGRFEQVLVNQDFTVIVDYAHTPDSLENVLKTIQPLAKRKIYVVVGTGGDRDKTKRPLMAQLATAYASLAIFTTDNPRTEAPQAILNDMITGIENDNFIVIEDRAKAIKQAVQLAKKDDLILIAGKGHEAYQEINDVKYDFDDRIIAAEAIKQKEK